MNHIFGQCSVIYCFHDFNQIAVQQFQNNLSFWIAKAAVILDYVWTLWCQHQTKVQTTFKWSSQFLHCCNGWFEDLVHTFLCNFFGIEWVWCNCTHTAGVKALVAVQSAFVVHRRNHRNNSFSVHKCQNRNFRSGQEFFHNNMVAAGTEYLFFHDLVQTFFCFLMVYSDNNALAQCQTVCFDNYWVLILLLDIGQCLCRIIEYFIRSGWDIKFLHQVFGENLACLDLCSIFCWAKGHNALFVECINHACCKRVIRCNNNQIDRIFFGEVYNSLNVHCLNIHTLSICADTAVTWTAIDFFCFWALF